MTTNYSRFGNEPTAINEHEEERENEPIASNEAAFCHQLNGSGLSQLGLLLWKNYKLQTRALIATLVS
jgi:hypothetical protein